jgi:beta-lactam-binding protein with PASTA domain
MSGRPVLNFLQGASLVMVLVAVALLAAVTTMHFAIHGAEVQVPALKGMTVAEARSQTAGLGLLLDVDNRYYSGEVAAGHILTQSPTAGTVVRREWKVRVAESLGPQTVNVPDTVGKEQRVAELELRRAGLGVGLIAQLPFARAAEGTVLAQDPPGKAQGIEQPSINLLVAAPDVETADGFLMPDLTGMTAPSALAELTRVGIKAAPLKLVDVPIAPIGTGDAPPRPPIRPNSVLAQQPPAGVRVDQTTLVKLVVGR